MRDSWPTSRPAPDLPEPAAEPASGVDLHLDLRVGPGSGGRRAALERALRDAVRSGRLAPGSRLPSSRRLATETGLSRGTVKAAYDQLSAEGYLTARRGSGTLVAGRPAVPSPTPSAPGSGQPQPRHDLRPGSPDVTAFPTSAWLRATRRALAAVPSAAYDYGDPRGRIELRTALAEYLGRTRGVFAEPERIVVTSGYVQGLALLVRVAARTVAMEDPGLPFHREVVRQGSGTVLPLPTDERGVRSDLLSASAQVDAVVVTPAHQYPTGVTLHPARRQALTAWARASGGLVIEDDYDGEFRYDRQPVGALQGMAPDHVVYLGTASKTLGPALRLGWMVLPPHLVEPVAEAKLYSDFHTGAVAQLALAELIRDHGYDRHVRACRLRYRRRRDLLVSRLPGSYEAGGIAAGLHALITLPEGTGTSASGAVASRPDPGPGSGPASREREIQRRAARLGLAVGTLADHWHEPSPYHPQGLIVGYGTPGEGAYPAALDALVRALA